MDNAKLRVRKAPYHDMEPSAYHELSQYKMALGIRGPHIRETGFRTTATAQEKRAMTLSTIRIGLGGV